MHPIITIEPSKPRRYRVIWHNSHACGALPGTFTSRRAAERAGAAWRREMINADEDRAAARREYGYEVEG